MAGTVFPKLRGADVQQSRTQDNIAAVLNPLAQALANTPIMGAPPPGWISPSLLNGFSNVGPPFALIGFHLDVLGYFHGKGVLKNTAGCAAGTRILVLPPGYRPAATQRFAVEGTGGTAQFVSITAAGAVAVELLIAAGGTVDFALTFLAEQ